MLERAVSVNKAEPLIFGWQQTENSAIVKMYGIAARKSGSLMSIPLHNIHPANASPAAGKSRFVRLDKSVREIFSNASAPPRKYGELKSG